MLAMSPLSKVVLPNRNNSPHMHRNRVDHVIFADRRREILVPDLRSTFKISVPSVPRTARLLVASIARGRRWLNELIANSAANTEASQSAKDAPCGG